MRLLYLYFFRYTIDYYPSLLLLFLVKMYIFFPLTKNFTTNCFVFWEFRQMIHRKLLSFLFFYFLFYVNKISF